MFGRFFKKFQKGILRLVEKPLGGNDERPPRFRPRRAEGDAGKRARIVNREESVTKNCDVSVFCSLLAIRQGAEHSLGGVKCPRYPSREVADNEVGGKGHTSKNTVSLAASLGNEGDLTDCVSECIMQAATPGGKNHMRQMLMLCVAIAILLFILIPSNEKATPPVNSPVPEVTVPDANVSVQVAPDLYFVKHDSAFTEAERTIVRNAYSDCLEQIGPAEAKVSNTWLYIVGECVQNTVAPFEVILHQSGP